MISITIGRHWANQINPDSIGSLSDERIDEHHAVLEVHENGRIILIDRNSQNGTFVNGYEIPKNMMIPVYRGDVISFANAADIDWELIPESARRLRKKPAKSRKKSIYTWLSVSIVSIIVIVFIFLWLYAKMIPDFWSFSGKDTLNLTENVDDSIQQFDDSKILDIIHNNLTTIKIYLYRQTEIKIPKQCELGITDYEKVNLILPFNLGSGFMINQQGYLLTNYHVIQDASEIWVKFPDNSQPLKAETIASFEDKDVAILKIPDSEAKGRKTIAFPIGDTLLAQGDDVYAIGYPGVLDRNFDLLFNKISWDLYYDEENSIQKSIDFLISAYNLRYQKIETSLTKGVISQPETELDKMKYIVTDAPINPGNSGGPLFNKKYGVVVGMNTAKVTEEGVENVGFAIHYKELKKILRQNKIAFREQQLFNP
ncbi:MAG: serine protease Do [Bacteroidota bacterium]|nr:serine protease Do [Bacteroidota bacterium]